MSLKEDFRRIDPSKAKVILIEASAVILSNFPLALAESARKQLSALGVEIWTIDKSERYPRASGGTRRW